MSEEQQLTAEAVLATIRSRGYWQVQLRPATFDEKRIGSLSSLEQAIRRAHVQLRGWDYPHVNPNRDFSRHKDFIQGLVSWGTHHEVWRLYQSAQFVHVFAMMEDWLAEYTNQYANLKPGEILEVTSTLWTFTEMFLFFGRLVESLQLTGDVVVSYRLVGLAGRQLQTLDARRMPLHEWRKAASDLTEFDDTVTLPAAKLIGSSAELAVEHAMQLYERFHWQPDRASLVEEQRKLL